MKLLYRIFGWIYTDYKKESPEIVEKLLSYSSTNYKQRFPGIFLSRFFPGGFIGGMRHRVFSLVSE